jgi:hypothetical protein
VDLRNSLDHLAHVPLCLSNPHDVRYWRRVDLGYEQSDEEDFKERVTCRSSHEDSKISVITLLRLFNKVSDVDDS